MPSLSRQSSFSLLRCRPQLRRALWVLSAVSLLNQVHAMEYPATRRVDQTDDYHGVRVADPYRWLEADVRESSEVAAWVGAQSEFARLYLDAIPSREVFRKRLASLYDHERFSIPTHKAGRYFYFKNDGLQDQAVLYVSESPTSDGRVLLDPNTWSDDGTIALAGMAVSEDGSRLAYARSSAGSDWRTIHVIEIETGKALDEVLEWVRFGGIDWDHDGEGFYYTRYPEPKEGDAHQSLALDPKLCYHRLGQSQAQDRIVYERPDHPDWSFGTAVTDDGEMQILSLSQSTDPQNQVWLRDLTTPGAVWTPLVDNFDHEFGFVAKHGERLYFLTDDGASRKRLVAMVAARPDERHEVVPETDATLVDVDLIGERFVLQYLRDVHAEARMVSLEGDPLGSIDLPGLGSANGFHGEPGDRETFYSFANAVTPTTIWRYDLDSGASEMIRRPEIDFDSSQYQVEQVFYPSKDGTKIPMTLAYRRDAQRDGARPTLLYAYGGFAISITPSFNPDYAAWMERGGVLAIANLRGGGEYGEAWHQAGKKEQKQNVFDDFISAAEWLIDNRFTRSDRLAIRGGSNGGLLVGAVMTQRPDLFGACLPAVGVHDMLRFHKFTAGQFWRAEYGSADEPDEFPALRAYSPYHNVRPGTAYPATMVTTADTDDRVVPMHSFKFAAALQHAQQGDAAILLRVEIRAGHGAGTPVSKQIELAADTLAFLANVFKMDLE